MAMKAGGDGELNAEINVTPLVDVMLVLLIIFMIAAPMMNTAVSIELPHVTAQNIEDPNGKLVLTIQPDDRIYLGVPGSAQAQVKWADLEQKLKTNERIQTESALFIAAPPNLLYGRVITAMAIAKNAGVTHVMMLTSPTDKLNLADLDKNAGAAPPSTPK